MPPTLPPCILDIEASGFGPGGYPIEIGYVRGDGQAWCTLVRPEADWRHWDAAAERVHGISSALLHSQGRPVLEVARRLNHDLAGLTVYSDAWAHDYPWLGRLFDAADLSPSFRLESVLQLLPEPSRPELDRLRHAAFGELGITRHRASSDARALQWALARLAG
ncbi:MAG: hypothetical protein KBC73_10525 [Burkholderiaceae bacterium]|nr:hypothetical protein [Burkholderiaceae bacterium]